MVYTPPEAICNRHCWHISDDPNCHGFPKKQIEICCKCSSVKSHSDYTPFLPRPYSPWVDPRPKKRYNDKDIWYGIVNKNRTD